MDWGRALIDIWRWLTKKRYRSLRPGQRFKTPRGAVVTVVEVKPREDRCVPHGLDLVLCVDGRQELRQVYDWMYLPDGWKLT